MQASNLTEIQVLVDANVATQLVDGEDATFWVCKLDVDSPVDCLSHVFALSPFLSSRRKDGSRWLGCILLDK